MNTPHVRAQLSAYLDGELSSAESAGVQAHVDGCADCRARLSELRATARLIGALPDPVPTRRLTPRLAGPPAWLAPLRTLTTLASGLSVFVFLATALLANIGTLAQGTASLGAGGGAANAPAASAAAFGPVAPSPSTTESQRNAAGASGAPAPVVSGAADSVTQKAATASPDNAFAAVSATGPAQDVAERSDQHAVEPVRVSRTFANPWLWLALAIITGVIALYLQRRLATAA